MKQGTAKYHRVANAHPGLKAAGITMAAVLLVLGTASGCGSEGTLETVDAGAVTATPDRANPVETTAPTAPETGDSGAVQPPPTTPPASNQGDSATGGSAIDANLDNPNMCELVPADNTSGCVSDLGCDWAGMYLTDIRVGRHDGDDGTFDRVVFDLSGDAHPCYFVFFDDDPMQDGSGYPVELGGYRAIRVNIPKTGPEFPEVTHGYTASLDGQFIKFAMFDTFFEGTVTAWVAVSDNPDITFTVTTLPGRLVVDVAVPAAN
jgi:hypothetical protein